MPMKCMLCGELQCRLVIATSADTDIGVGVLLFNILKGFGVLYHEELPSQGIIMTTLVHSFPCSWVIIDARELLRYNS